MTEFEKYIEAFDKNVKDEIPRTLNAEYTGTHPKLAGKGYAWFDYTEGWLFLPEKNRNNISSWTVMRTTYFNFLDQ